MARLASELWVQAYLMRCGIAGIPGFVVSRGDSTAGAVIIKLNTLDGNAVAYERRFDLMRDTREWVVLVEGRESDVDDALSRTRARDPDLWIIEVEDRAGRHLLDEPGLDS